MKRIICLFMAILLVGCTVSNNSDEDKSDPVIENAVDGEGMQNQMRVVSTIEEAQNVVGYPIRPLNMIDEYELNSINILSDDMVEVVYHNEQGSKILYRISVTRSSDDMDDDFSEYDLLSMITIRGIDVDVRENKTENENIFDVYVAKWSEDEVHYMIHFDEPIEEGILTQIIFG